MALVIKHKDVEFGIGDKVRISLRIQEGEKERIQIFEGIVIAIKNRAENTSFTVRKIGAGGIGVERIFPLSSPKLEGVAVTKKGTAGVRRAKLYYIRNKSPREIDKIYTRTVKREKNKKASQSSKNARPKKH